jgi:hypothetical protein
VSEQTRLPSRRQPADCGRRDNKQTAKVKSDKLLREGQSKAEGNLKSPAALLYPLPCAFRLLYTLLIPPSDSAQPRFEKGNMLSLVGIDIPSFSTPMHHQHVKDEL